MVVLLLLLLLLPLSLHELLILMVLTNNCQADHPDASRNIARIVEKYGETRVRLTVMMVVFSDFVQECLIDIFPWANLNHHRKSSASSQVQQLSAFSRNVL